MERSGGKKMIRLGDFKINKEQKAIIDDIVKSGRITEHKYVKMFEEAVAKFIGVKHAIAVANGTLALELVANYLRDGHNPNYKPVACIPALTFPATLNAFYNAGYEIILCDVDRDLGIDLSTLNTYQKRKIDVVIPVHILGYAANMQEVMSMAKEYDWDVVEDFAESFGTKYDGKRVGSIGDFGISSFYVSHVIQAGELGVVTTNDDFAAAQMRSMKNHGRNLDNPMKFDHIFTGSNYKTTEFCAGLGYEQMGRADEIIAARHKNAKRIYEEVPPNEIFAPMPTFPENAHLGYPIMCKNEQIRDKVVKQLNDNGIETRHMFPCLASQPAYRDVYGRPEDFPVANFLEKACFYVGVHQFLKQEEVDKIIKALNDCVSE